MKYILDNHYTNLIDVFEMFPNVFDIGVVNGVKPPRTSVRPLDGRDLASTVSRERHHKSEKSKYNN